MEKNRDDGLYSIVTRAGAFVCQSLGDYTKIVLEASRDASWQIESDGPQIYRYVSPTIYHVLIYIQLHENVTRIKLPRTGVTWLGSAEETRTRLG